MPTPYAGSSSADISDSYTVNGGKCTNSRAMISFSSSVPSPMAAHKNTTGMPFSSA